MNDKRQNFFAGLKDGIPICLGYFAVSFAIGVKAFELGIGPWQAFLYSVANLTSAGQVSGLEMFAYSASLAEVAFAQLVINLRYCLMSATLSQKLIRPVHTLHRFLMAYGVTDEVFALSAMRPGRLSPWYTYGLLAAAVPGWGFGTLFGALFSSLLPASLLSALGIAIYGMFIAIIVPPAREKPAVRTVVLIAMALSAAFAWVPLLSRVSTGFRIIIIALGVSAAAAVLAPVQEDAPEEVRHEE